MCGVNEQDLTRCLVIVDKMVAEVGGFDKFVPPRRGRPPRPVEAEPITAKLTREPSAADRRILKDLELRRLALTHAALRNKEILDTARLLRIEKTARTAALEAAADRGDLDCEKTARAHRVRITRQRRREFERAKQALFDALLRASVSERKRQEGS
jgi:hypothetical protein